MATLKHTLLIIDDSEENISLLQPFLTRDYEVLTALSGDAGLRIAHDRHPDIILLDIRMPRMDGLEVLKRLKADAKTKDIVVVMLTAKDNPESILEATQEGALDYIVRMDNVALLLAKLRQISDQVIAPKKSNVVLPPLPMPAATNRKRVFLSYSNHDVQFATYLKHEIEKAGYEGWIDHSYIKASQYWLRSIEMALKTCHAMVLIMTPSAMDSHFVTSEYLAILNMKKPLIPLLYSPCEIPFVLEPIHRIDYQVNPAKGMQDLLASLSENLV
jgi:DNA-binding response OmpR family regulator